MVQAMCLELACLAALAYETALSGYTSLSSLSSAAGGAPEALGYTAAAVAGAIVLLRTVRYAFRPQKRAPAVSAAPAAPAAPATTLDLLARLARLDYKVELIATSLEAITGVHVYYAAPGGMKLHASVDCTLLSHSKELATLTVTPDVHAFLLRAQVVCMRCGYEAPH